MATRHVSTRTEKRTRRSSPNRIDPRSQRPDTADPRRVTNAADGNADRLWLPSETTDNRRSLSSLHQFWHPLSEPPSRTGADPIRWTDLTNSEPARHNRPPFGSA